MWRGDADGLLVEIKLICFIYIPTTYLYYTRNIYLVLRIPTMPTYSFHTCVDGSWVSTLLGGKGINRAKDGLVIDKFFFVLQTS